MIEDEDPKRPLTDDHIAGMLQQQGISVSKSSAGFLMVVGFVSEDGSMAEDDIVHLIDDPGGRPPEQGPRWKIAVIDDEPAVHDGTRFALHDYRLNGQGLEILSAYSAAEGRELSVMLPMVTIPAEFDQARAIVARELEELGFANMRVWSRGVDPARFSPSFRSNAVRERLGEGFPLMVDANQCFNVSEAITRLCPTERCPTEESAAGAAGLSGIAEDAAQLALVEACVAIACFDERADEVVECGAVRLR